MNAGRNIPLTPALGRRRRIEALVAEARNHPKPDRRALADKAPQRLGKKLRHRPKGV